MKALFLVAGPAGGSFEFRDVPTIDPGPGQARIRVHASGLNRGTLMVRAALRGEPSTIDQVPAGVEFAGEVDALGEGVAGLSIGDRVMGRGRRGTAEYVTLDSRSLVPVPAGWSWEEAAAVPNVFVTSHDAIVTNGRLEAGESFMVTAGSSGIGTASIQIAQLLGADPVMATTRSPESKGDALRVVGADIVVDTSRADWPEVVREATGGRGVNLIIDTVGAPLLAGNLEALALSGRMIGVGRTGGRIAEIDLDLLALKRLSLIGVTFRTRTEEEDIACTRRFAEDLMPAFENEDVRPVMHRAFPWEEIELAYETLVEDTHIGKIVVVL